MKEGRDLAQPVAVLPGVVGAEVAVIGLNDDKPEEQEPGDPLDRLCRANGVRDLQFVMPDGSRVDPLVDEMPPDKITSVLAAPDGVVAAPQALLAYIEENGGVQKADLMGPTWIIENGEFPVSKAVPNAVQPLMGAGPDWLAAQRVTH